MAKAVEDFGDRNLKAIGNQSDTVGRGNSVARPDVDSNMVMVTAGSEEQGPGVRALRDRQTQELTVESFRHLEIGDVKVDMPNVGFGWWFHRCGFVCRLCEQIVQIQRFGHHCNLTVTPGPL